MILAPHSHSFSAYSPEPNLQVYSIEFDGLKWWFVCLAIFVDYYEPESLIRRIDYWISGVLKTIHVNGCGKTIHTYNTQRQRVLQSYR